MKIINEDLSKEEELLEDIQAEYDEKQETLDEVRQMLLDEDFEEEEQLNGVAFVKEIDEEGFNIKAQMYVDTTTFDYSCYVSTSTGDENKNDFSSKGQYDNLVRAAKRLIFEVSGI